MELSYILSKNVFLIFREMERFDYKIKNFQKGTFQARKIKKNPLWKKLLYFRKWNFLAPSLENSYTFSKKTFSFISRWNLQSLKSKSFLYFRKWNFLIFSQKNSIFNFLHQNSLSVISVTSNKLRSLFFFNNIFTFF